MSRPCPGSNRFGPAIVFCGMKSIWLSALSILSVFSSSALSEERRLFDFRDPDTTAWKAVNDGVMGGRSRGGAALEEGFLRFSGNLSLENNGGFSSIRAQEDFDLAGYRGIRARVRGDGRTYQLRLQDDSRHRGVWAVSFQAEFETVAGEWIEVFIPFDSLAQTWRGRTLSGHTFDPGKIELVCFLLADKKAAPFQLDVAWVSAVRED